MAATGPILLMLTPGSGKIIKKNLKVLTSEKRVGLKVVTFDRSPFKLSAGPIL